MALALLYTLLISSSSSSTPKTLNKGHVFCSFIVTFITDFFTSFCVFFVYVLIDAHTYISQKCVGGVFLIELAMVGLVSGLVIGLAHTVVWRTGIVGALAVTFGTMTYLPRLSHVVRMPQKY